LRDVRFGHLPEATDEWFGRESKLLYHPGNGFAPADGSEADIDKFGRV
jgi:hypothetical protein